MPLEDREEDLTWFEFIKEVHEVNNHKGADQLISAYSRAEWVSPEVSKNIKSIVKKCKICTKVSIFFKIETNLGWQPH